MKKQILTLLLGCIFSATAFGQIVSEESLLDISTARQTDRSRGIYSGTPFVHIDGITQKKEQKSEWMSEEKIRLFGTTDILKTNQVARELDPSITVPKLTFDTPVLRATITPTFGDQWTTPLTDHTGDRSFILQLTPVGDIIATETIQIVQATPHQTFSRTFPILKGQETPELISLLKDKKAMKYTSQINQEALTITDTEELSVGEHRFEIIYKLPRVIRTKNDRQSFELSLTGSNWPTITERFSGVLLMPQTVQIHSARIGFGKNNLILTQGSDIKTDQKGNIFFKTNRLIPAFADIRLNVSLDGNFLNSIPIIDRIEAHLDRYALLLLGLLLFFYAGLTVISLRYNTKQSPFTFLSKTKPVYFDALIHQTTRSFYLKRLIAYEESQRKNKKATFTTKFWYFLSQKGRADFFMHQCLKYQLIHTYLWELILLIGIFFTLTLYLDISLNFYAWIGVFCAVFITLLALIPTLKKVRENKIRTAYAFLSNKDSMFGLNADGFKRLFIRLYPYILSANRLSVWTEALRHHNLNISDFKFLSDKDEVS